MARCVFYLFLFRFFFIRRPLMESFVVSLSFSCFYCVFFLLLRVCVCVCCVGRFFCSIQFLHLCNNCSNKHFNIKATIEAFPDTHTHCPPAPFIQVLVIHFTKLFSFRFIFFSLLDCSFGPDISFLFVCLCVYAVCRCLLPTKLSVFHLFVFVCHSVHLSLTGIMAFRFQCGEMDQERE